jgi:hypothetical protein
MKSQPQFPLKIKRGNATVGIYRTVSAAGYESFQVADRSTGLIVFGILEMLLGYLCALLVPLMVLGQVMSAKATGGAPNYRLAIPGVLMYGTLAVALVWLGIGSVRCRRWARALVLVLSWSWLVVGVIAVGFTVFWFPKMMAGLPSNEVKVVVFLFTIAFLAVIFIVVPGALVFFYDH